MAVNQNQLLQAILDGVQALCDKAGIELDNPLLAQAKAEKAAEAYYAPGGAGYARMHGLPVPKAEVVEELEAEAEEEYQEVEDGDIEETDPEAGDDTGNERADREGDTDLSGSGAGVPSSQLPDKQAVAPAPAVRRKAGRPAAAK
jgi:hypothetical protein